MSGMRVLAFDACLGAVSAAIGDATSDGAWSLRAAECVACAGGHAETLMPMLARVSRAAGVGFADIDRIVTTVGPGGFTGVRIGVAAARAFAVSTGCDLVGLSAPEALALEARAHLGPDAGDVIVANDGRRGMVFYARFSAVAGRPADPQFLTLEAAAEEVARQPALVIGSAAAAVLAKAGLCNPAGSARLPADLQPNAATFAPIGAQRAATAELLPLYLRPPDAKEQSASVLARASS